MKKQKNGLAKSVVFVTKTTHRKMKVICAKEGWTMDMLIRVLLDNAN